MTLLRTTLVLFAFLPGLAQAADLLKASDVTNFVTAYEKMEALQSKYPDVETNLDATADFSMAMEMIDRMIDGGKLNFLGVVMEEAMQHPQMSADLRGVVKSSGFASVDQFSDVGNRIIAAYMRSEMSGSDLREMQMMGDLPESQLAMIPAPMRKMAQYGPLLARALEKVPADDVKLVKKMKPFD